MNVHTAANSDNTHMRCCQNTTRGPI